MAAIADRIAQFHLAADRAPPDGPYGTPAAVIRPVRENFSQLDRTLPTPDAAAAAAALARWTEERFATLRPRFSARRRDGYIRECHGDLHLRNMARIDGRLVAFDGIEFDPALRWIDVISDSAFLLMDLVSRERPELGWHFLNRWLEVTGDYDGLPLLTWYLVYRHMVRTKVDGIRLLQPDTGDEDRARLRGRIQRHLSQAIAATAPAAPRLLLMWGLSGSGKSWLSERLADHLPAIRVRSDVERKRLLGPDPAGTAARFGKGLYTPAANDATYNRLLELSEIALTSGFSVIVDAAFLDAERRAAFRAMADRRQLSCLILCCEAAPARLRERIRSRSREGRDPSDAGLEVLDEQLRRARPLTGDEVAHALRVPTDQEIDVAALRRRIDAQCRAGRS
jgi:predicted kinase